MTLYEGLYRSIKELMPDNLKITFNNFDENSENCGVAFKGAGSDGQRALDSSLFNRKISLVINYNTKDTFIGYEYGEKIIDAFSRVTGLNYIDDKTNEYIVSISNIKLLGNINYIGKNKNNALNCFSLNFIVTYGKLREQ